MDVIIYPCPRLSSSKRGPWNYVFITCCETSHLHILLEPERNVYQLEGDFMWNEDIEIQSLQRSHNERDGVSIASSTVCSGADHRKHQSSAPLVFVRGIHQWPVNSPHKGPIRWKMFPFDNVIMIINMFSVGYDYPLKPKSNDWSI